MFRDVTLAEGQEPDVTTVRQLLGVFDLASDPVSALRVQRMFQRRVRYGDNQVQVESGQFLDRVRSSGHDIAGDTQGAEEVTSPDASAADASAPDTSGRDTAALPRYRWLLDYLPRVLPCGAEVIANVRFRNTGAVTFRHRAPGEIRLCAFWFDQTGVRVEAPDMRTPLPLDVPPGREITTPIHLRTPSVGGHMQLQLTMVQEGARFLHHDAKRIPVRLGGTPQPALPTGWVRHQAPRRTYEEDHVHGRNLLGTWLGALEARRPRVLEVGGNASPMIPGLIDAELYNLDVDLLGLQVAAMVQRSRGQHIACLCADAEDLPFPPGFFDAIVLFATLHHFPDPVRLLGHLATRLRAGGFIGVLCEPVGHIDVAAVDRLFLAELRKGVNEQSFTAAEYGAIFRRARLRADEVVIDVDSLKARLVPFD
ncbi:MAG: class I SAM-dependent methyltransferase [Pseudomonadota bacterium]|nr:class I SAM-dependent methyltransferase [Pseudomonadota bacterium]